MTKRHPNWRPYGKLEYWLLTKLCFLSQLYRDKRPLIFRMCLHYSNLDINHKKNLQSRILHSLAFNCGLCFKHSDRSSAKFFFLLDTPSKPQSIHYGEKEVWDSTEKNQLPQLVLFGGSINMYEINYLQFAIVAMRRLQLWFKPKANQ